MRNLVQALISYVQNPVNGVRDILGTYTDSGGPQYGPFLDIAPEGTDLNSPYMTFNIGAGSMDQGFRESTDSIIYTEKVPITFHFFDPSGIAVATNGELFMALIDQMERSSVTLGNSELFITPIRRAPLRVIADPIQSKAKRMYHGFITYEFRSQQSSADISSSFTGQLATSNSMLGNLVLGTN